MLIARFHNHGAPNHYKLPRNFESRNFVLNHFRVYWCILIVYQLNSMLEKVYAISLSEMPSNV